MSEIKHPLHKLVLKITKDRINALPIKSTTAIITTLFLLLAKPLILYFCGPIDDDDDDYVPIILSNITFVWAQVAWAAGTPRLGYPGRRG
eukprot:scaffold64498_cov17-Prasinocladus_malaysianus.AAC.1